MATYPPPPPGYDPRVQRRLLRDQARAQRAAFRMQREQMRFQMRSLRRGSVVGPILLIAVGVVFLLLQTGHIDHRQFWDWYGHWWPLLLVCAGLIVLAEWGFDQFNLRDPQRPAYRRSVGGGVIILVLLFAIAGVLAGSINDFPAGRSRLFSGFHFDQDSIDQLFGDKHESDQTVDVALPAGSSLTVVNPRGDVTISGTSDDGHLHIAVHKQVYSRSDSEAESRAQQLSPQIQQPTFPTASGVTVTMPSLEGGRADLVITTPAEAAITVTANRGDIHIASIKSPVAATANHGDIELSAITGLSTAHINSGGSSLSAHNIEGGLSIQGHAQDLTVGDISGPVTISGEVFGTIHLQHINGAIHFHTSRTDLQFARLDGEAEISPHSDLSADQVLGPVVLTTSNRNITLDRIAGDIAVTNRNGTIDLTAAPTLGNITLQDRNGSIKATLPDGAGFSVQAGTTNGNVDSEFQLPGSGTENSKSVNGTVGAGGPMVRITTTNGDISLHKGDVPPIPPTPPAPPKITLVPPKPSHPPKVE
jgi:DUF4097 and DUF4098 domain-containing protein YvlB